MTYDKYVKYSVWNINLIAQNIPQNEDLLKIMIISIY